MSHLLLAVTFENPQGHPRGHQADASLSTEPVDEPSVTSFAMGSGVHRIPPTADDASDGVSAMGDARWWQICDRAAGTLVSAPRACRRARMRERLARWAGQLSAVRRSGL